MITRVTLRYFVNDCRIRGTKKGSVNIGNYADSVAFVHLINVGKLIKVGGLLDWAKINILVALSLHPQMFM